MKKNSKIRQDIKVIHSSTTDVQCVSDGNSKMVDELAELASSLSMDAQILTDKIARFNV